MPKLRVTWRIRALSAPQLSHRRAALLDPNGDDDDLPRRADLDDAARRVSVERLACDDVLAFARPRIALSLDDFAGEDDVFNVEDADFVIVKLVGGVERDHVPRQLGCGLEDDR